MRGAIRTQISFQSQRGALRSFLMTCLGESSLTTTDPPLASDKGADSESALQGNEIFPTNVLMNTIAGALELRSCKFPSSSYSGASSSHHCIRSIQHGLLLLLTPSPGYLCRIYKILDSSQCKCHMLGIVLRLWRNHHIRPIDHLP